jgi:hypothetical protein
MCPIETPPAQKASPSAESVIEVSPEFLGSRLGDSLKGIVGGLALFGVSFVILSSTEGRVSWVDLAKKAELLNAQNLNDRAVGKLVSISAPALAQAPTGDSIYLKPGDYLAVERKVEMFSWIEEKETKRDKNLGGSETQRTTYSYHKDWTHEPAESSRFKISKDNFNPAPLLRGDSARAAEIRLGAYRVEGSSLQLPAGVPLTLSPETISLPVDGRLVGGDAIFRGAGSPDHPKVGDLRIRYEVVRAGFNGTLLGKLEAGGLITSYIDPKTDVRIHRLFRGSHDEALAQFKSERKLMTWFLRAVGFFAIGIGLSLCLAPLAVFAKRRERSERSGAHDKASAGMSSLGHAPNEGEREASHVNRAA